MGGDYTRFTFDPVKGFSGVLKQQGRVSLDSDANEFEAILDRRDRAEMYDTVGQAVYPITTPDAFKIGVALGGRLTIGRGRLYVDGILAECFGDMSDPSATAFDERMNGLVGTAPLRYDEQPFFYSTPPFPGLLAVPAAVEMVNLLYLDVWQREVTVFEDYGLREIALGGPDTATRVQTAWQIKVMQTRADAGSCAKPPAQWAALVAPSTARLTTAATPAPAAPGPCVIDPVGGYTGLENRLYRVEIHTAGTVAGAGSATFKWSRANASLAARVKSTRKVTATDWVVELGSTGRDAWQRLEVDDHVELLDDGVEFSMRETGRGGVMARVTQVNHATGEIHVDQDLTTLPVVAGRHARLRRWDVDTAAEPLIRETLDGIAITLEEGISVMFGPDAAATLRAGDHWVFAARTADGSIEPLLKAPPRGPLHHFARLALVTTGPPPAVLTDCRVAWPPSSTHEGCCTQVVWVGEDIQKAIDRLDGIGGCVCLKMGVHLIGQPLRIKQENVTIHGEVPWVTVRLGAGGPHMLDIAAAANVSVEGILFEAPDSRKHDPMIRVSGVHGGRIADCGFRIGRQRGDPAARAIGITLTECHDFAVERVHMSRLPTGVSGHDCTSISVLDCRLDGPRAFLASDAEVSLGEMGIQFDGKELAGIVVERNVLAHYQRGVQLGDVSDAAIVPEGGTGRPVDVHGTMERCRVASNTIRRQRGAPVNPDVPAAASAAFAIAAHVPSCEIVENAMDIATLEQHGVLVAGGNTLVHRNEVRSTASFDPEQPLDRLPIGVLAVETQADALVCSIRGNFFSGLQQAVVAIGGKSGSEHRVDIVENRVTGAESLVKAAVSGHLSGAGNSILTLATMLERFSAIVVSELSHCRVAENEITQAVCGVAAVQTHGTSVVANRVRSSFAGIVLLRAERCEACDNVVTGLPNGAPTLGIGVFMSRRSVVARNAIWRCENGVITVLCSGVRVQENEVYDSARVGIRSLADLDLDLCGNAVEDAAETGISVMYALHETTIAHDRTLRCGYRSRGAFNAGPAIGIEILLSPSLVNVDGCRVIDTGESPTAGAPAFTGPRHGITVLYAIGARVHGCEIASRPLFNQPAGLAFNAASRALRMWTMSQASILAMLGPGSRPIVPFSDAADNVLEQSAQILVEIIAAGEVMFATNRCMNFEGVRQSTVVLAGSVVTVTGNRVRARGGPPSLTVYFGEGLSAVGNATTGDAVILPGSGTALQTPAPYSRFNVITS